MVFTGKNDDAGIYDVVVRVGKFKEQGKKLVIQKGSTIISVSAEDAVAFAAAVYDTCAFKSEYKQIATFELPTSKYADLCEDCPYV